MCLSEDVVPNELLICMNDCVKLLLRVLLYCVHLRILLQFYTLEKQISVYTLRQ